MPTLDRGPDVPQAVLAQHPDWKVEFSWQSSPSMRSYRLTSPDGVVRYVKVSDPGWLPGLLPEVARMRWAGDHLPVPTIIRNGTDGSIEWLLTHGLAGVNAADETLTSDPERLVALLAKALRQFHSAPVRACPFDFRLDRALRLAGKRLEGGLIDPDRDFHEEFSHLDAAAAVERLEETRPRSEDLVVCHGDYCPPNIVVDDWRLTGFLDLGELGVADRWWDLAVATWSLTWNLGPGHEGRFLEEYGIEPDEARIDFYRLLYDVVS